MGQFPSVDSKAFPDVDGDGLVTTGTHGPDDGKVHYPKTAAKIGALMERAGFNLSSLARELGMQCHGGAS